MGDEIDRAQAATEVYQEAALLAHKRRTPPARIVPLNGGARDCLDCGKPIPAARLKALPNAIRCIECQNKKERMGTSLE
ncbi:MAG: TraR/DksA family transcriptional regulator [Planctomycetaceae bacterium]|nr:TraR/DksA family transcriptional regulator [Planctomycetaceae bacterium]